MSSVQARPLASTVASSQWAPSSSDTNTFSPSASAAVRVPLMLWLAVFVTRSVPSGPVSLDRATEPIALAGSLVSTVTA